MIEEGISKATYERTDDTTLQDLKSFQDFLYRNFYNYVNYQKMYRHSNQPAKLYGTAKTHTFKDIKEITKERIELQPIIDQTSTYTNILNLYIKMNSLWKTLSHSQKRLQIFHL